MARRSDFRAFNQEPSVPTAAALRESVLGLVRGTRATLCPSGRIAMLKTAAVRIVALAVVGLGVWVAFGPVLSARWQVLDDGILIADGSLADFHSATSVGMRQAGRNFYFSGLYFEAQRQLFGREVRGFYLVQGTVVAVTLGTMFWWVRRIGGQDLVALACVTVFAISSAVPEVTHTLYKLEVRLVPLWLLSSILAWRYLVALSASESAPSIGTGWQYLLAAGLTVYAGCFFGKETIALLVPASAGVAAVGLLTARPGQRRYALGMLAFVSVAAGAVVAAKVTNSLLGVASVTEGSYSSHAVHFSIEKALGHVQAYLALTPDLFILASLVGLLALVGVGVGMGGRGFDPDTAAAGMAAASCLAVLAFHVLLWDFILVYYLYPAAAFGAVAIGLGWKVIVASAAAQARPLVATGIVGCLALVAFYSVPLHEFRSTAARRTARADADMLQVLASLPPNSRIGFDIPPTQEVIPNMRGLERFLYRREDLKLESAISDGYFDQPAAANDYVAYREFTQWAWDGGNRGVGRSREAGPNDLRLRRELATGNWQEVGVIAAAARTFDRNIWPVRHVNYTYEWRIYKRK